MRKFHLIAVILCALPAACSTPGGGPLGIVLFDKNQHLSGASPMDGTQDDLCLNDSRFLSALVVKRGNMNGLPERCAAIASDMAGIYSVTDANPTNTAKSQRNLIVSHFATLSTGRCGQYLQFLAQYHGNVNSTFGIGTQMAAIIAALTTGGASQILAGVAGGLEGARSNLVSAHFHNQALGVIVSGFEARRTRQLAAIDANLRKS